MNSKVGCATMIVLFSDCRWYFLGCYIRNYLADLLADRLGFFD